MNNRKLLNVKDLLIIALLLGLAFGAILLRRTDSKASWAVITLDGAVVDRIPIEAEGSYVFPDIPGMTFTVSDGAVSVTESGCKDKVCVRTGAVSHRGEAVICVPNRVAVTVEGSERDLDVVLR